MAQKVIHVGIGVFGKRWCSEFLKSNIADGTIEVVALVDTDAKALETGRIFVGPKILQPPGVCAADVHLVERRRDAEETPGVGGHGHAARVVRLGALRTASARTG